MLTQSHVVRYSAFFLQRGYPVSLLEEAATLARNKDRDILLNKGGLSQPTGKNTNEKVFFISTYNPNDDILTKIVRKNWHFLGKSPTTSFIHERKLTCGYRLPKNLRDRLVKANIPFQEGDEQARPNNGQPSSPNHTVVEEPIQVLPQKKAVTQTSITDFFKLGEKVKDDIPTPSTSTSQSK
jgi:hypothetical protein